YVGGLFTTIGARTQHYLAAVRVDTAAATIWAPSVLYPLLTLSVPPDGRSVYSGGAGGNFTGNRATAWDATTGAKRWETYGGDGDVQGLAVTTDGRTLYMCGHFLNLKGLPRNHVAAIDTATGTVLPFAPVVNSALG